jgi:SRSO17 transposase
MRVSAMLTACAPHGCCCTGLLPPGDRKSIEPMARRGAPGRGAPGRVQADHRSLQHLIAKADRSDAAELTAVRVQILPAI